MVHIGYCIGRKWWNKGITSEALIALVNFFFQKVKVNRIEARCVPENHQSSSVLKNVGLSVRD